MATAPRFVGIDASKAHLDVASRPDGEEFRLPNALEGIASPVGRLKADALDARVLAHPAEAVRPEARELPDEETRDLRAPPAGPASPAGVDAGLRAESARAGADRRGPGIHSESPLEW